MTSTHPGKMIEYCRARQVLAQADFGTYIDGVLSDQEFRSGRHGHSNLTYFAIHQWLKSILQGNDVCKSCVTVSVGTLPGPSRNRPECHKLKTPDGFSVDVEMSATPFGHGASGAFPSDTQDTPTVVKKGPAQWVVAVEVTGVHHPCCAGSTNGEVAVINRYLGRMLPAVVGKTSGGATHFGCKSQVGCVWTPRPQSRTQVQPH